MTATPREIVEWLITEPAKRIEIWTLAVNRGLGAGMQIEKWLLIEMLALKCAPNLGQMQK